MNTDLLTDFQPFQLAGYRIEPASLRVIRNGTETRLARKAMLVLLYLVEQGGGVVSRSELEEHIWAGRVVTEDSVTNAIAKLRRVFEDDAHHPRVIETVPKSGYRLIADVVPVEESEETVSSGSRMAQVGGRRGRIWGQWWMVAGLLALVLLLVIAGYLVVEQGALDPNMSVTGKPALAVLPFENLGERPDEDYFANGITADLITDLSRLDRLTVIAPGSVFSYQDTESLPSEVSRQLGVDYVIVGSVQRLGDRLRINVQLIEARAERALWGERYSGRMADMFDLQDRLAAAVIGALRLELSPSEQAILTRHPSESVPAYDLYLRGLAEHGTRSRGQNLAARALFEQAIILDPGFARAYTGLAMTYAREAMDGWTLRPSSALTLAEALADMAAGMDPMLPQVYFVAGLVALFQGRYEQAIAAAERGVSVDPNYADAYALWAWILSYEGHPLEAMAMMGKAMVLNPRPPASYLEIQGEIRFVQGRYEESADVFQQVLRINPSYGRARLWNAAALAKMGRLDEAQWETAELLIANPSIGLPRLGFAFPFRDPETLDTLLSALRLAGLPD